MARSRPIPALVLAAGLLALGACSSSPAAHGKPARVVSPTSWTLSARTGPAVALGTVIGTPVLEGSTVFYAFTDEAGGQPDKVAATDLTTGRRTVLVDRTFIRGGTITGVALSGWVVYAEESAPGPTVPGSARWVIVGLNPSTGQRKVLMRGGPDSPGPDLTGGREATWVVFPAGRPKAYTWAPGQGAPRAADAMPGDAAECTAPTAHQERVGACVSAGGVSAWTEKDPSSGLDDAAYLFVTHGSSTVKITDLEADTALDVLGDFLLWDGGSRGLRATSLAHPDVSTRVAGGGSFYGSTDHRTAVIVDEHVGTATARLVRADQLRLSSS